MRKLLAFPNPLRFFKAVWKSFRAWRGGSPVLVPPVIWEERYLICQNDCLHFTYSSQCDVCSCFADAKAWLAAEECPLGRWQSRARSCTP